VKSLQIMTDEKVMRILLVQVEEKPTVNIDITYLFLSDECFKVPLLVMVDHNVYVCVKSAKLAAFFLSLSFFTLFFSFHLKISKYSFTTYTDNSFLLSQPILRFPHIGACVLKRYRAIYILNKKHNL
jgi:hypothetical protein